MIIPIGHDRTIRGLPWVTIGIIAVCTLVQLYSSVAAPDADDVRRLVAALERATPEQVPVLEQQLRALFNHIPVIRFGYQTGSGFDYRLITSAFVHQGWFHLIGNMLFLFLAGSALEDRWGRLRFLAFYVAGGAAATLCFDATYRGDTTLLVGASGAIAALMGAFLVNFARTQIILWYWLLFRTGRVHVAAYVALPLWLAEQILWAHLDGAPGGSGVAYTAHIGGFLFGVVVALIPRLFGTSATGAPPKEVVARVAAPPIGDRSSERATLERRYGHAIAALRTKDAATALAQSSRLVLELAHNREPALVLEMCRAIFGSLSTLTLTDEALEAAASAADAIRDREAYVAIATTMLRDHPTSKLTPKVVWRLAEHHRDGGRIELAVVTLRTLAAEFPDDPFGVRAREALASRPA